MSRADLPTGTVTLLFTDVEGSTRLLHDLGPQAYADVLLEHRRLLRDAFIRHGGVEVDTEGDAFFVAFADATEAVAAAADAQQALAEGPIRVRMGLHTGTPHVTEQGYVGTDVHLGARIGAAGHGGQVLLSNTTADALADGVELLDLGEHRLKDFAAPVWIYQLGTDRFPPLKSISNTNLPRPASAFVGREKEVGEITAMLRDGGRLVTLTGPGGTGKTRLSIEAAAELVPDFRNGTFWVDLAPLTDPALVPATVGQTIGAKDGLVEHIGQREMLLVLDNLEQVIEAAPDLSGLVEACPNLRLLVTSRERLRVKGEIEYAVPPLALPEAVELFANRSGLTPTDTITELCRRLDNLPLAVELAAARAAILTPAQILDRLAMRLDLLKGGRGAEARQATLRATIEWSYDLLKVEEQRLFARLAVFAGGWTLEAAEQVAEADIEVLQSLVDKSLVHHEGERFTMLETIRQFALERLAGSGEAPEIRGQHASYFKALGQAAEPYLRSEVTEWVERMHAEQDNLRAAFDWLQESGAADLALELIAATWHVWSLRGPLADGRHRVGTALAAATGPTAARARALTGACDMALDTGEHEVSRRLCEEALALHRQLGDRWGIAYSLLGMGLANALEDIWPEATSSFAESARIFEQLGDEHMVLQTKRRLAWSLEEVGDLAGARALQEEVYRRARVSHDEFAEARSLAVLAQYELDAGRVDDRVIGLLNESHRIHRDSRDQPDRYSDTILLCRFALALGLRQKPLAAVALLACFELRLEEIEGVRERWVARMADRTLALVGDQIAGSDRDEAESFGRRMSVDEAVAYAVGELESQG